MNFKENLHLQNEIPINRKAPLSTLNIYSYPISSEGTQKAQGHLNKLLCKKLLYSHIPSPKSLPKKGLQVNSSLSQNEKKKALSSSS